MRGLSLYIVKKTRAKALELSTQIASGINPKEIKKTTEKAKK